MLHSIDSAAILVLCAALTYSAQSSGENPSPQNSTATQPTVPAKDAPAPKKHNKKVWTNDELPSGGGLSVVGGASATSSSPNRKNSPASSAGAREKQIASYRKQLTALRGQREATGKKISELRNFKADNTSPAGGINPRHGYGRTPVEDQIKQLEDKKKQIQSQIDDLEDQARKAGIQPGEIR